MNKVATGLATAVVLAGVAGTTVAADAASSATGQGKEHVIRLEFAHEETHSPQPDQFLGTDRFVSPGTHEIIGYDTFFATLNPKTEQLRIWTGLSLQGGVIDLFSSAPVDRATFTGPITHGTGKFAGITGTVTRTPIGNTNRAMYILRYRL